MPFKDREVQNKYCRDYYYSHKEQIKEQSKKRYDRRKEQIKSYKQYRYWKDKLHNLCAQYGLIMAINYMDIDEIKEKCRELKKL